MAYTVGKCSSCSGDVTIERTASDTAGHCRDCGATFNIELRPVNPPTQYSDGPVDATFVAREADFSPNPWGGYGGQYT